MSIRHLLVLAVPLTGSGLAGQTHATIVPVDTAFTQLVSDQLAGFGVQVLDAGFQFLPYAVGTFTDSIGSIGMTGGMVLATGLVHCIEPPNLSQGTTMGGGYMGMSDPDLAMLLVPQAGMADAAILHIDLVPYGDTLRVRYVFGSEEYDEYVCSTKNDVLGIFLSGPGISGPYSGGAINLALLPATGLPVCVNTVNNGLQGSYGTGLCWAYPNWQQDTVHYVDNFFGPHTGLDGYTEVLTATSAVQSGATYHLKVAIADVGDDVYDSAVFLEAGSLDASFTTDRTEDRMPGRTGCWYDVLSGTLVLEGLGNIMGDATVEVFDASGRCVLRSLAGGDGERRSVPLSVASGIYVVRTDRSFGLATGRIIVP